MKFRFGLIIGLGAGYYLGTAAGRERHEQIKQAAAKLRRTGAFDLAADKAKAVVDLTVERARDIVGTRFPEAPSAVGGGNGEFGSHASGPDEAGTTASDYSSSR